VCNCVTIAISNAESRDLIEEFVAQSGVPRSAVNLIKTPEVIPAVSLLDKFRPVTGGIAVTVDMFYFLGFGPSCTLTAIAHRAGQKGFIVNSHCTATQGGVEGTRYSQEGTQGQIGFPITTPIATEAVDPTWTARPGCPSGRICRRSDSAFAVLDPPAGGSLREIALPSTLCTTTPCGLNLLNASDRLSIVGLAGAPVVGDVRNKIGRTTGHTGGRVNRTCVTVNAIQRTIFDPSNFTAICQNFAGAAFARGDSGSPVFSLLGGNRAVLAGTAWGFGGVGSFIFSAIADVESELGSLSFANPAPRPPAPTLEMCAIERNACMRDAANREGPRPAQCVREYAACTRNP
jgi:hypothetical protein